MRENSGQWAVCSGQTKSNKEFQSRMNADIKDLQKRLGSARAVFEARGKRRTKMPRSQNPDLAG